MGLVLAECWLTVASGAAYVGWCIDEVLVVSGTQEV